MAKPTEQPVWLKLQVQQKREALRRIDDLFSQEPGRADKLCVKLEEIEFDFSRSHVSGETLGLLIELARAQGLDRWREKLFSGERINASEGRSVLHTALRASDKEPLCVEGQDISLAVRVAQEKIRRFVTEVREDLWLGATGRPIRHVVNIGIGGSDLGPRLVTEALARYATGPKLHFVANVDASDLLTTLSALDPATTLFVVVSKTFTTQETLLNARTARQWLIGSLGEAAVAQHFVAVSSNKEAVESFGIDAANMFTMWDWVGGRYSLWSAVGIGIALSIGWDSFKSLLAGAEMMDQHFLTTPWEKNAPILAGLIDVWYRNFWKVGAKAILPYSERLRNLPRYLQQLEMESNGKSVTREGRQVDYETSPIIFGECGTVGQHSFHQWLHQGSGMVQADFIGVKQDDMNQPEHHLILHAHMLAQIEALKSGCLDPDPARTNPGNKPANVIWLEQISPFALGALLAFYEHRVFVQGVIWDINSFDQFGVELGKKIASALLARGTT